MDLLSMAFEVIMIGAVVVGIAFIVNRATDLMTKDEYSKTKKDSEPVDSSSTRNSRQTRTEPDLWHKDGTKTKKKKTTKKKKAKTKSQSGGKSKAASSNVKQSKK